MFTIKKHQFMKTVNGRVLFVPIAISLTLLGTPVAFADNTVNLKVLVVTTGDITQDAGLAYIQPVLDEMGVQYDVVNAATQNITTTMLSANGCAAATVGCTGNYNGVILTDSGMVGSLTPAEWDALHAYEKDFHVREVVLSGWPGTYWDPNAPWGIYLDYGLSYTSSITSATVSNAQWTVPAANSTAVFEYVNKNNPLPITDFAYAAKPRGDAQGLRDGTVPSVTPLLQTPAGEALVSVIQYKIPLQTTVTREVMLSTISNASFLTHSQVLGYEFVNWVTQGVFVGGRYVYMSNHLDDLFLANDLWDAVANKTGTATYRLSSADVTNAVNQQKAFRTAHPLAGTTAEPFKLDFAFNGAGAVVDPTAAVPAINTTDGLVSAIMNSANKNEFRYINHTFTHADMDSAPTVAVTECDYDIHTQAEIEAEIMTNRTVWGLLTLPEQTANDAILVTGNHSGLRNRNCTDYPELHPTMFDVQSDDIPFVGGANPLFLKAATTSKVTYLASDTSQINQATEQYISAVDDGSATTDRLLLPRYPTSIFFNVKTPTNMTDEYNYIFHDRYVEAGQNPCNIPAAICTTRTYAQILTAEATAAVQHMLSFKKFPHFFHQMNVANYGSGKTLQFDWLNAVYTAYEKLFNLPVKNLAYYTIGDMTKDKLTAKSAKITATWNRTTNQVSVLADKAVPNLLVTGLTGGEAYGGQSLRAINVTTTPQTVTVDQKLTQ